MALPVAAIQKTIDIIIAKIKRGEKLSPEVRRELALMLSEVAKSINKGKAQKAAPQAPSVQKAAQAPISPKVPTISPQVPISPSAQSILSSISQKAPTTQKAPTLQIPGSYPPGEKASVQLLWALAGGDASAFVNYLRSFPDPDFLALQQDPVRLVKTVEILQQTEPQTPQETLNGIEASPLKSSNIWGYHYDQASKSLLVRFNSGAVYGYGGVPEYVFNLFKSGASPCKTSGHNQWGKWWKFKQPSLGSALFSFIKKGSYPYQRLA